MEPKLPPRLTHDPRAAERALPISGFLQAGGDCSFGSKEEARAARPCSGAHHLKVRHLAPDRPLKSCTEREVVLQPGPLAAPVPGSERPTLPVLRGET